MTDKSYKTAIARNCPSRPITWVQSQYQVKREDFSWSFKKASQEAELRILDYGCGRGYDADYMSADKYDPHWFPKRPRGKYDIIFCTYVLNVVPEDQQHDILDRIDEFSNKGTQRYVTVRRDLKKEDCPIRYDGYAQYYVEDSVFKDHGYVSMKEYTNDFEIYLKFQDATGVE